MKKDAKEDPKKVDPKKGKEDPKKDVKEPKKEQQPKKEKKSQKQRPRSKKKHAKVKIWNLYHVKDGKLTKNESCPRCGAGTFLAKHKNRKWCGKCFWSIIESKAQN